MKEINLSTTPDSCRLDLDSCARRKMIAVLTFHLSLKYDADLLYYWQKCKH